MNIPAPGSGYSDYGYSGGSIRSHFVDDPYGSYGSGDSYQSADINAYKQQLQSYYQQLMSVYRSLQAGDPRRAQCEQYIQMSLQYAQQVGLQLQGGGINEWDPNAAMTAGQGVSFPISYQDGNHIVTDEGPSTNITVRQNDSVTKQIDVYQKQNTLQIPSNAASVNVTQVGDTCEVTITFPNGTTRKIIYHDIDREEFSLNIQAADESQINIDASVSSGPHASKITKSELGSSSSTQQAGDPPTRMDGDKRVYDGQSFDISPVPTGTNKQTNVLASGDVTITPNSNEEYYVMEYNAGPPAKYTVKVYANEADKAANKIKETITIDGALVDHINFGGDPSRIEFAGVLHATGDVHTLNTGAPGANKISLGASEELGGNLLNPDSPADTELRVINGSTAISDVDADQTFHTTYDRNPAIETVEITAGGTVDLYPARQSDTVSITTSGSWYVIEFTGTDANGNTKHIKYKVKKEMVDKINIHADPTQITGGNDDPKIQKGEVSATTTPATTPSSNISALFSLLGINASDTAKVNEFLAKVKQFYPSIPGAADGLTLEELNTAIIQGNFPPAAPDNNLINFLRAVDPNLNNKMNALANQVDPAYTVLAKTMVQRAKTVLEALYQGTGITIGIHDPNSGNWTVANNLTWNGQPLNIIKENPQAERGQTDVHF